MTSQKQIDANRRNSRKSTGPTSVQGKARSSQNAVTHGVLSDGALASHEDKSKFEKLLFGLRQEYEPGTMMEIALVERLANLLWRERRLAELEAEMIGKAQDMAADFRSFLPEKHLSFHEQQLVGRYQTMLGRQIRDTRKELEECRKSRES